MDPGKEPSNSYLRGLDSTGKDASARGCSGYVSHCFAYAVLTADLFLETIGERLAERLSGADNAGIGERCLYDSSRDRSTEWENG